MLGDKLHRFYSAREFLEKPFDPMRWLVPGLLPCAAQAIFYGDGSTLKSWVAFDIAIAVATGTRVFNRFPVHTTGPVVVVSVEGNMGALQQRFIRHFKARELDPAIEWWRKPFTPDESPLWISHDPVIFAKVEDRAAAESVIAQVRPVLVVWDPLAQLMGDLDENDTGDSAVVHTFLNHLRDDYGVTNVLIHHKNKQDKYRGSSSWRGWADTMVEFTRENVAIPHFGGAAPVITMRLDKQRDYDLRDGHLLTATAEFDEGLAVATLQQVAGGGEQRLQDLCHGSLRTAVFQHLHAQPSTIYALQQRLGVPQHWLVRTNFDAQVPGVLEELLAAGIVRYDQSTGLWHMTNRHSTVGTTVQFLQDAYRDKHLDTIHVPEDE